ncbi:MAG TPA: molecular chaperone DnaJ [Baekduia sp.]|nr:molecular chaperone DnaJ [Baekduia sp.]
MSTRERDPYEVLGVGRDADEGQIKKAFRKLARELHPDVNDHDPDAEEKFKEAAEAYEILNDAERRRLYDQFGHEGLRSGGRVPNFDGFGSISDLFQSFFGGGRADGPRQGQDIALGIELDMEESFRGVERELSFEAVDRCEHCNGNGAEPGTPIKTCERCGGQGVLQGVQRTPLGDIVRQVACDVCDGDGRVAETPCETCDGRGRHVGTRDLKVEIPAGIDNGQRVRIAGRGHAGERGGPPGDLYVVAQIRPDSRFMRDGDDLYVAVDVGSPHAVLGVTKTIEHFDGPLEVKVKPGSQPGDIITIRGKGMPSVRRRRHHGDLHVVVNVVVLKKPTKEQKKLLQELADSITPDQLDVGESLTDRLRRLLLAR